MKKVYPIFFLLVLLASSFGSGAPLKLNGLYVNSFGSPKDPSLIFVHGGPGYDSQDFEWTTAATLAAQGFFVIVYDQRGQGRSDLAQLPSDYSYSQYANDLSAIIQHFGLAKPILLGHSHGGPISLKFDQLNPGIVGKIVLISAPVNFWKSMQSIQINCTERYLKTENTVDLAKLNSAFSDLTRVDVSIEAEINAVAAAFQLGAAKLCGLYRTKAPTAEAIALNSIFAKNRVPALNENLFYPMPNFLINEKYIRIDQSEWVQNHAEYIFGIYGDEDGLFTGETLLDIQSKLAKNPSPYRFQILKSASHGLYIDQQAAFFAALKNLLR